MTAVGQITNKWLDAGVNILTARSSMSLEGQTGGLRPAVIACAGDRCVRNNSAGVLTSVYILLRSTSNVSNAFVAASFCMGHADFETAASFYQGCLQQQHLQPALHQHPNKSCTSCASLQFSVMIAA